MAISTLPNSIAKILNQPLPGQFITLMQVLGFGSWVRGAIPTTLRRVNMGVTNPYIVAGQGPQQPDDAKALTVIRAVAIAGTGTLGDLVVDLPPANVTSFATGGTGPAAGHIGVSPSGDIVTNATDAFTSLDVTYQPDKYDVAEYTINSPSGVATLPAAATNQGVVALLEAEILVGTVTGKCAVLPPSAGAAGATKQAKLNLAKTTVSFLVADAPTSVRLKVALVSAVDQNALLESASPVV